MIKLKSLFRRGQGPSGSSKHSNNNSSNNRNKSQSTTSLNTITDNEQRQQQQQQQQQQHQLQQQQQRQQSQTPTVTTKFYQKVDPASERGIDIGDAELNNAAITRSGTPDSIQSSHSNTLPHKKTKLAAKKGQKQPKQVPVLPSQTIPTTTTATATEVATFVGGAYQPATAFIAPTSIAVQQVSNADVMTTIALSPGNQNSAVPTLTAPTAAALNNNYSGNVAATTTAQAAAAAVAPIPNDRSNDLYQLNSVIAAANYEYQLINNEQQHLQLIEANSKMQELQTQLEQLGREKLSLEARVSELMPYQSEVGKLKSELLKMQALQEKSQMEIVNLKYENESLRNRLRDVVNSPLSDAEKHQIIQDSQRLHSSAPASIALPSATEIDSGTPCLTPDWDKHSSSSEISVACLQDKIIQMEETHYSTNEELQATLQELADLQSQLSDAQTENERLAEEKDVLFQSLCRQTEKLNESRTQITTLQELLLRDAKQAEISTSEREKKLLDLIKTSQEERETILVKQEELNSELQELRLSVEASNQDNNRFRERIALLDSTVDAANAERKQMEAQLLQAKEEISQRTIEINRLTTLLDNARSKIDELEQDLARGEKTDLSDLLDAARKEKDTLEERVAEIQDQYSRSQAEIRRLKEQLSVLNEECKVAKNNAKCAVSHLEYRLEQLQQEKDKLSSEFQQLTESTAELQVQCKCHLEDKTQLQNLLSETQKHLGDAERKLNESEELLEKEVSLRKQEAEEWQQFQSDLLMTVRVANDFKTEALSAREQLVLDNKTQKEKIRLLEQQIDKLTKQQLQQNETQQSVLSTVQQEMASRRNKVGILNRQDSRLSVKTLIESIENNKQSKTEETDPHLNSSSPIINNTTPETTPNILPVTNNISNDWSENVRLPVVSNVSTLTSKVPLREQQNQSLVTNLHISGLNNVSKSLLNGERKDPLNMLAKNGGSKRNALLKWCQNKTVGYRNIDITNFSSSWNDGLALCAILHSYLPDRIPYDTLSQTNKRRNFSLAFAAAESVGISTTLNINDMCQIERPDWTQVMTYVTAIYKHFET
ncbi:cytospin-A [Teleopsis dalmanni]|uniref:cytospin-A n=1 Tax=Teleopsis dalmanni TaxID=139649 RepID=UPI0018CE042B|nr:cytospin-A [Teleopsis dalmanni]